MEASNSPAHQAEPLNTLMKAFSTYATDQDHEFYLRLVPYLKQVVVPAGFVLFSQGDQPDGLYLIEHGILRAKYNFSDKAQGIEESMVSGTLAGELTCLSGMTRNATVHAEMQSVLWKLTIDELTRLEKDDPETAKLFSKIVLKGSQSCSPILD